MYLVTGAQFVTALGIVEMHMLYANNWDTLQSVNYDYNNIIMLTISNLHVGSIPLRNAPFGRGVGPIWLDNLYCLGNESSLLNCSHRGLSVIATYCDHSDDVGVQCVGENNY